MDIRLKTCLIIRKNGEYLVGLDYIRGRWNWSKSKYDAWRTRDRRAARTVARESGGVLMLFNPIVGQIRDL